MIIDGTYYDVVNAPYTPEFPEDLVEPGVLYGCHVLADGEVWRVVGLETFGDFVIAGGGLWYRTGDASDEERVKSIGEIYCYTNTRLYCARGVYKRVLEDGLYGDYLVEKGRLWTLAEKPEWMLPAYECEGRAMKRLVPTEFILYGRELWIASKIRPEKPEEVVRDGVKMEGDNLFLWVPDNILAYRRVSCI